MTNATKLDDLDLAALLSSRVCHDVISPVGAITNGLELLEMDDDEAMREEAMKLVRKSAKQASAKLQFCRIAFGAAGSAGAHLDLGDAGDKARAFMEEEKAKLDWQAPRENRPKQQVKLLLNMMLIATAGIPKGGILTVSVTGDEFSVRAAGPDARVPEKIAAVIEGTIELTELDARLVQPYYARRLAESAGFTLNMAMDGADALVRAAAKPAAQMVAAE
jgi:histidine phosphotransferase ChpT